MESKNCREKRVFSSDMNEEKEEEEMDKFYEMMRKMKSQLQQLQEEKNMRKRAAVGGSGGWVPVFQLEDFTTEIEYKKHAPDVVFESC
ncbi:hypothetical protein CASFOL_028583 [Castilleja foliolosa]|uniref:Uncharacterized protein n=1 Tax=Castilleja foliolosa TaxID=1961234 RepID=A0ABD3CEL3_9LAMI